MAEATRTIENREIKTVVTVPVINLRLSIEETQFLHFLMERIGGDRNKSRRRHAESIHQALHNLVPIPPWTDGSDVDFERSTIGSIFFEDEPGA